MSAPLLVADSGPLIALARLDLLAIPSRIFRDVWVSATVWDEVVHAPRRPEHDALEAARATALLRVVDDSTETPAVVADPRLDAGERSALALALVQGAAVLVDERQGRAVAAAAGLAVIGTLGLLVKAREDGLVERVRPLVEALQASGYFLARSLVSQTLAAVGE